MVVCTMTAALLNEAEIAEVVRDHATFMDARRQGRSWLARFACVTQVIADEQVPRAAKPGAARHL